MGQSSSGSGAVHQHCGGHHRRQNFPSTILNSLRVATTDLSPGGMVCGRDTPGHNLRGRNAFTPGGGGKPPTIVSVNFQGRISPGPASTDPLDPADVAGVVAVGNWNNVPDADVAEAPSCYEGSPTGALVDSTGGATTITLTFSANGGWNNEATATTTGQCQNDARIIKQSIDDPTTALRPGPLPSTMFLKASTTSMCLTPTLTTWKPISATTVTSRPTTSKKSTV